MSDLSNLGLLTAFAAGIVSFLSPCVLPLVPGYLSFVVGHSLHGADQATDPGKRASAVAMSVFFVAGFSTVFLAFGASATVLGQWLLKYRYEANIIGGLIVIAFGLFMIGMMNRVSWFHRDLRFHPHLKGGRPLAAYVLGAILTVTAVSEVSVNGVSLLGMYAAGLGVPFLLAAAFTRALTKNLKLLRHLGRPLQVIGGIVLVLMGIAMVTGQLTAFAWWLLRTFPVFGRIG